MNDADKRAVMAMIQQYGANRRGLVLSYQSQPPMAKVALQPDGQETGWCPVLSQWVGNGWGLVAPLQQNDQVALMVEEGDGSNYAIVGRYWSDVDVAPGAAAAGELLLQHQSGSMFYLKADGTIASKAPTWNHRGNLSVTDGDITADGTSLKTHLTSNVQEGTEQSGPPVAGT